MKCSEVFNLYPETCCTLLLSKLRVPPVISAFIISLVWGPPKIINLFFWCFLSLHDSLYLTKEIKHLNLFFFPSTTHLCAYSSQEHVEHKLGGFGWAGRLELMILTGRQQLETVILVFKTFSFINIHVKKKETTNKTNKQKKIQQAKKKKKRQKI